MNVRNYSVTKRDRFPGLVEIWGRLLDAENMAQRII
jgi:hypothetical protein